MLRRKEFSLAYFNAPFLVGLNIFLTHTGTPPLRVHIYAMSYVRKKLHAMMFGKGYTRLSFAVSVIYVGLGGVGH